MIKRVVVSILVLAAFMIEGAQKEDVGKQFLDNQLKQFNQTSIGIQSHPIQFQVTKQNIDVTHYKQTLKGIPVFASDINLQIDYDNQITYQSGNLITDMPIYQEVMIEKDMAKRTIQDNLPVNIAFTFEPIALMYFIKEETPMLTWHVQAFSTTPYARWHGFVDVSSGKIVQLFNNIPHAKNWDTHDVTIRESDEGLYYNLGERLQNNIPNLATGTAARNVHAYVSESYDYFKNTFNRDSYDDNEGTIVSLVDTEKGISNAFWNGSLLYFGAGGDSENHFGQKDVVAHELGHGVTEYTSNLIYFDQAGALNESMSDIWGVMVDRDDWLIGDDVFPYGALRSMRNPSLYRQPDHMDDYNPTLEDNKGVHINSGIVNKAFYNIAMATSKEIAEQIYYRASTMYFTQTTDFIEARIAIKKAAVDLYGIDSSAVQAIDDGFTQVGINLSERSIIEESFENGQVVHTAAGTIHYYTNNYTYETTFTHENASAIKVNFSNFDTEHGWDFVSLYNQQNQLVKQYSGNRGDFESVAVAGNTLRISFTSDTSITSYGFDIASFEYLEREISTGNTSLLSLKLTDFIAGPNPYNPTTGQLRIDYHLTKSANGALYIYTIGG